MFELFGLAIVLVGCTILVSGIHLIQRALFIRRLEIYGTRVIATVTSMQKQVRSEKSGWSDKIWDRVPYYDITAQWQDPKTQQVQVFRARVRGPLSRSYAPGHFVSVLIHPNDPKHHHIEL